MMPLPNGFVNYFVVDFEWLLHKLKCDRPVMLHGA